METQLRWRREEISNFYISSRIIISCRLSTSNPYLFYFWDLVYLFIYLLFTFVSSELAGKVFARRIYLVYADTIVLALSVSNFSLCNTQALWPFRWVVHKGLWRVTGTSLKSLCGDFRTSSQIFWQCSHGEEGSMVPIPGSGLALVAHSWPTECAKGIWLPSESWS